MQRLEVSGAVRPIYGSLGVKRLITKIILSQSSPNLCKGRPPAGVTIPDAVQYNFDLLMMSTTVLETCRGKQ